MDQTLAAIYGTSEVTEEDVEKVAAAELAEKLASGEAELDDDTLEALANEVLAAEGTETAKVEEPATEEETVEAAPAEETAEVEEPATEEAAVAEPGEKTAESEELSEEQQKIAEADYLGRVMAHAFVQESREIEKSAAAKKKAPPSFLSKAKSKAGDMAGKAGAAAGKVGKFVAANKGKAGLAAAGVVAAGAGAAALKKSKEKKSSAMETLIAARAAELCQENGVDPAVLSQEPEKQADAETVNPYDVLASKVEEGAWELLKSKGLVEEQVEAAKE